MTLKAPQCPTCHVAMDEGFLVDRGHLETIQPPQWVDGPPEKSFWTGTKTKGKEKYRVSTFRCDRCGFLRSFAVDPA